MSNSRKQSRKNSSDNVFGPVSVGLDEAALVEEYLGDQDFAANTHRAVVQDLRKFAVWFSTANAEPFCVKRVSGRFIRSHWRSGLAPIRQFCLRMRNTKLWKEKSRFEPLLPASWTNKTPTASLL